MPAALGLTDSDVALGQSGTAAGHCSLQLRHSGSCKAGVAHIRNCCCCCCCCTPLRIRNTVTVPASPGDKRWWSKRGGPTVGGNVRRGGGSRLVSGERSARPDAMGHHHHNRVDRRSSSNSGAEVATCRLWITRPIPGCRRDSSASSTDEGQPGALAYHYERCDFDRAARRVPHRRGHGASRPSRRDWQRQAGSPADCINV